MFQIMGISRSCFHSHDSWAFASQSCPSACFLQESQPCCSRLKKARPRPPFYCPGSHRPCSVRTQTMAANTASTLIEFLLEPAPLEHLLLDVPSEDICSIRQRELTAILDACCTQLEHDGPPHPEAGDQQMLINVELADQLREFLDQRSWITSLTIVIVVELGSVTNQATQ